MLKSNKLELIRERIIYFADNHCSSRADFLANTGLKKGIFDPKDINRAVGSDKISNILDFYQELNVEWLLKGKGSVLLPTQVNSSHYNIPETNIPIVAAGLVHNSQVSSGIPLVSGEALGGFGNMHFVIREQDIQEMYKVPDFIDVDFMIRVKGSSMYPKYNSGDVVACRIIKESQFIQWNKVHVIATVEQGILIKRIDVSDEPNRLKAISDNKDYRAFDIPKEEITGLALVVGVIRLE